MRRIIGVHPIDTGGLDMAARRAAAAGANALQVFTAIPKFYGDRSSINPDRLARFHAALDETGISREHVLVHAAYVLSVATAEPDKWERAAAGLAKEMERSTAVGAFAACFHPGSASDGNPDAACERVARAMALALEASPDGPRLLVENTAGAGRTVGRTAAEVARILRCLPSHLRRRAGYGLDTCHLFASGYDIHSSRERFTEILDEFEETVGERPAFFHLNDSQGALGSNRDRHTLIGEGEIGVEPFRWLVEDRRAEGIPLILETPEQDIDIAREDPSADPWDARMVALVRSLAGD